MIKTLFHGNKKIKKNEGYTFLIALYFLFALSLISLGVFELVKNKYSLATKKSSDFYESITEENEKIFTEENN